MQLYFIKSAFLRIYIFLKALGQGSILGKEWEEGEVMQPQEMSVEVLAVNSSRSYIRRDKLLIQTQEAYPTSRMRKHSVEGRRYIYKSRNSRTEGIVNFILKSVWGELQ